MFDEIARRHAMILRQRRCRQGLAGRKAGQQRGAMDGRLYAFGQFHRHLLIWIFYIMDIFYLQFGFDLLLTRPDRRFPVRLSS
jgi:hypothetical protein